MSLSDCDAALLGRAADGAAAAMFVADRSMRWVAVNEAACELLGYTRSELLQIGLPDVSPDGDVVAEQFDELVEHGQKSSLTALLHRDGSTVLVRYYAKAIGEDLFVAVVVPQRVIPADVSYQEAAARGPRNRKRGVPTARETEILHLMASGLENDEIARSLYLALDTVKTHISRLLQKLGARSRTHAVAIALRRGLIE